MQGEGNQGVDLLGLAGGVPGGVTNFAARPRYTFEEVYPYGHESLKEITEKARRWKDIVMRGESLAVAFGMLDEGTVQIDFEREAQKAMTPKEEELFKAWKAKGVLPPLRQLEDRRKWSGGESQKARANDLVGALRIIYKNPQLDRDNLQWFLATYSVLAPLLTAVAKIARATRSKTDAGKRDASEFQEHLAASRAIAVQGEILSSFMKRVKETTRELASQMDVVQARQRVVNPSEIKAGRKRVLGEEARVALGAPAIAKPTRWVAPVGAQGRLERAVRTSAPRGEKRPAPSEFAGPSRGRPPAPEPTGGLSPTYRPVSPALDWEALLAAAGLAEHGGRGEERPPSPEDEEMSRHGEEEGEGGQGE